MSTQEKEYLELFKKQIEVTLGWGKSEDWSNADFEKLSELVFEKTGINLSISTLKRVWGKVRYDSVPTTTTLNTLVQFSGYRNWRTFCAQTGSNILPPENALVSRTVIVNNERKNPGRSLFAVTAVILVISALIAAGIWAGFFKNDAKGIDRSKIVFTSRIVSDDLPNSVVFNYDVGNTKTDNVIIQQSWDRRRRETVPANQHQHTSIYYYPGLFKAKLLINNRIVSEHELFIKTKGWQGFVDMPPQSRPIYLSAKEIGSNNGMMKVTAQTLTAKTGKSVFNDIYTVFSTAREFDVNPDDFTFNTTLQNTSAKEAAICQQVRIDILSSNGFISIPLSSKGCTSDASIQLGNNFIDGKDTDLSVFGCDFSKPHQVTLKVKDKKALVYIDQKQVYSNYYTKKLGRIVGLTVVFEGTGEIKNISIN